MARRVKGPMSAIGGAAVVPLDRKSGAGLISARYGPRILTSRRSFLIELGRNTILSDDFIIWRRAMSVRSTCCPLDLSIGLNVEGRLCTRPW